MVAVEPLVDRYARLAEVRFCVLDLETTGTSDEHDDIVEVGAVVVQGGNELGTFQTLVRHPLAAFDTDRPTIGAVLASLLEFTRGAVVVGHNIQFDLRFLNAALRRDGRDDVWAPAAAIDTMHLARRLLRGDADDCRLGTLAERFDFHHRPTHRALADAQATVELLHLVIERATHYGALDLDDLLSLPQLFAHRERDRLALTAHLPRSPGVACLRDRHGGALHVVRGDDLRQAVRSLFGASSTVPARVLHQLHRIDVVAAPHRVVADLAALRWAAQVPSSSRSEPVYLRATRPSTAPRFRLTSSATVAGVIAGPFDRAEGNRLVAAIATFADDRVASADGASRGIVEALSTVARAVERHELLLAGRAASGEIVVDGAAVIVDGGRVVDVVIDGRSWVERLPDPPQPTTGPLSAGHAGEALVVAGWLRQAALRDA